MNQLKYCYVNEERNYSYYTNTWNLLNEEALKKLEMNEKVLYGLMYNRSGLSRKSGWFDKEEKLYIIFTLKEVMQIFQCSKQKGIQYFKSLEACGLITRKKRGLGRACLIYVIDCRSKEQNVSEAPQSAACNEMEPDVNTASCGIPVSSFEADSINPSAVKIVETENSPVEEAHQSYPSDNDYEACRCEPFPKVPEGFLTGTGMEPPEVPKWNLSNNTENYIAVKKNITALKNKDTYNDTAIYPSVNSTFDEKAVAVKHTCSTDHTTNVHSSYVYKDAVFSWEDEVKEQIDYDILKSYEKYRCDNRIDELVMIMADVLGSSHPVRIRGAVVPAPVVHSRFRKLTMMHIQYILECLNSVTERIRNIRSYLITALFYAPSTMSSYYSAKVQSDMYSAANNCQEEAVDRTYRFINPETIFQQSACG